MYKPSIGILRCVFTNFRHLTPISIAISSSLGIVIAFNGASLVLENKRSALHSDLAFLW